MSVQKKSTYVLDIKLELFIFKGGEDGTKKKNKTSLINCDFVLLSTLKVEIHERRGLREEKRREVEAFKGTYVIL